MRVRSLGHVALVVSSLEKAATFYWEVFGFPLMFADEMSEETVFKLYGLKDVRIRYGMIRTPGGGGIEVFEYSPSFPKEAFGWQRMGQQHFGLEVKNVPKWYDKLKGQVEFLTSVEQNAGFKLAYLKDFDGNVIELIDTRTVFHINKWFGGALGWLMRRGSMKKYYLSSWK